MQGNPGLKVADDETDAESTAFVRVCGHGADAERHMNVEGLDMTRLG